MMVSLKKGTSGLNVFKKDEKLEKVLDERLDTISLNSKFNPIQVKDLMPEDKKDIVEAQKKSTLNV